MMSLRELSLGTSGGTIVLCCSLGQTEAERPGHVDLQPPPTRRGSVERRVDCTISVDVAV